MTPEQTKREEKRLFQIARRVLGWAEFTDYTDEELWDLVLSELVNIK